MGSVGPQTVSERVYPSLSTLSSESHELVLVRKIRSAFQGGISGFWSFAGLFSPCNVVRVGHKGRGSCTATTRCQHRRKPWGQCASRAHLVLPQRLLRDLLGLPSLLLAELKAQGISKILQPNCVNDSQRKLGKLAWFAGFGVRCFNAREDVCGRLVPSQVSASSRAVLWLEMYLACGLSLPNRFQM